MFKDMYKRANDSLPIDGAKARVMARLEKPAVVRPYKNRVLEIAALAACLVFTFAAVSIYRDFENNNIEQNVIITPDTPTSEPINLQEQENVQETIKEDSIEIEKKVQAPIKKEIVPKLESPQKEVASVQIEEKPSVSRSIKVEERAVPKIEVAAEEIASQEIKTAIVINEEKPVSGGGSAAAARYMMRDAQPLKELTKEEYYGYLGKNIEECVQLPEGFENITQDAAAFEADEEGNYKNDEWSFVFQKEEKAVEVITTKNAETVQDFIDREDYSKSTVCGVDAVVTKDDAVYRAYMVSEEIGYKITASGLMEAEVEGLLVSLVK